MVAVVSGNALGLSLGSMADLGPQGVFGQSAQGRSGDQVYVNATTGNLVVQRSDEYLASRGVDIAMLRTYNSRGGRTDDNGDNWQMGVYKKLDLSGKTKAGGVLRRTDGDGATASYDYDSARKLYLGTDGEGAYDTIEAKGKTWIWTDGTTGVTETYDQNGRLLSAQDIDGNVTTYSHNAAGLITRVTGAGGDYVTLDYVGNKLMSLTTRYTNEQGVHTHVRTHYRYDGQGRLSDVLTDLTLNDGLDAAGSDPYWTHYEYKDITGTQLRKITQKDGTSLEFDYDTQGRVIWAKDGLDRVTSYDYTSAPLTTRVIDPLGQVTTLVHHEDGRLKSVKAPAVNGTQQEVLFAFDATTGDLRSATDALGQTLLFTPDANGNVSEEEHQANGATLTRHYSATNRLLRETHYTGPNMTGTALSTRYVYDSKDHLRFVVSAEGRVTQYEYNALGERTSEIRFTKSAIDVSGLAATELLAFDTLMTWLALPGTDRSAAQRTDYGYDLLGQLRTATSYVQLKGNGRGVPTDATVVHFVYGASGRLEQSIDGNANQTTFTYDGLDRLIGTTDANQVTTVTSYDDAGNKTTVKLASDLWTVSAYNAAGELESVTQTRAGNDALGTTSYSYDANGRLSIEQDPTGRRTWHLYDAAGRRRGSVDEAGGLTEFRYDANNRLTRTLRHATTIDIAQLVNGDGSASGVAFDALVYETHADDRATWTVYDAQGRIVQTIDGEGHVVETTYDSASRILQVKAFAEAVALPSSDAPGPVAPDAMPDRDRVTRNFYDRDGKLLGTLDGEGYLTVHQYDAAGQRVTSRAYKEATASAYRAAGSLAQLTPAETEADLVERRFYDLKGRLVGVVDSENYLTEYVYHLGGTLAKKVRYADRVTIGTDLASTRPAMVTGREWRHEWAYTYTDLNQLESEQSPDGRVTRHRYDAVGNLVETIRGLQTEDPRTVTRRYDVRGRLVAELRGEGSDELAKAHPDNVEAIWDTYAYTYEYDDTGRRIASADPEGNRTLYFYDAAGRVAAEINGEREVQLNRYDPLGNLQQTRRFFRRLDAVPATGGHLAPYLQDIENLEDDNDAVTTYFHDPNGRTIQTTSPDKSETSYRYNAFGEVEEEVDELTANQSLLRTFDYDRRGLRLKTIADPNGLNVIQQASYDAFGRLETSVDGNTHTTARHYDRLGRLLAIDRPIGQATTEYDAFGRVKVEVDATGRRTETSYDTVARTATVTFSDQTTVVTTFNAHGEQVNVLDARGTTTIRHYDKDGRLELVEHQASPNANVVKLAENVWDKAGNLHISHDANNVATWYEYDSANRVLTQTVDPGGLNLLTTHTYENGGRTQTTTRYLDAARKSITKTEYDGEGRVRTITRNDGQRDLVTAMAYDGQSHMLSATDPDGRSTTYTFDALGRRKTETLAGDTTEYFYDKADNLTARRDGAGNVARYVYDENDRLRYEIDGTGGVSETAYDEAGRVRLTKRYVAALDATLLANIALDYGITVSDVEGRLAAAAGQASEDIVEERIFDANGRVAFTLDAQQALTRLEYDGNGNLVRRTAYANALDAGVAHTFEAIIANLPQAHAHDRTVSNTYDARNRLLRQLENNTLTVFAYDGAGNVVQRDTFATEVDSLDANPEPNESDRRERMAYDAAGRLIARATAQKRDGAHLLASVERYSYDGAGNVKLHRQHADFLSTATLGSSVSAWIDSLADSSNDRVQTFEYDDAGRMTRKTGPDGAVCDYRYDGAGNLVATVERGGATAADRIARTVYDEAGRVAYQVDAEGAVTRRYYDGAGRMTRTIRFADRVDLRDSDLQITATQAQVNSDSQRDRVEQTVYDRSGRVAYTVDAEGAARRHSYDGAGQLQMLTRYHPVISGWNAGASPAVVTHGDMSAFVDTVLMAQTGAQARVDTFDYDASGLLLASTDALGFSESYTYDALGNKLSFTNKTGATWDYAYDGAGHLVRETAPEVEVTTISAVGAQAPLATQRVRIQTELDYDAFGNLLSRTEAANLPAQQRTTCYEYDAIGRQVKTVFPKVRLDDGTLPDASDLHRKETVEVALESTVTYDALGNAISAVDVGGRDRSKTYDRVGRVLTETDALGGVTTYGRNALGDVLTLTRKGETPAQDRTITTEYDRVGRAVGVRHPSAFSHDRRVGGAGQFSQETRTEYDAFGQTIRVTNGGADANGQWFATGSVRYYHDRRGLRVGELAELDGYNNTAKGGYLTVSQFDAEGNATDVTQYATLIAHGQADVTSLESLKSKVQASGDDRRVMSSYDAMNRKSGETRIGRYLGTMQADGTVAVDHLHTQFYYDALGNLTGTQDPAGAITATRYDALGRKVAVVAPTRANIDGSGTVTPLTEFTLDAYGNVVTRTDYAGGALDVGYQRLTDTAAPNYRTVTYTASMFDAACDRRVDFAYDAMSRKTHESDASGVVTQHSYDAYGHVARTWTPSFQSDGVIREAAFTVNRYDTLGRLEEVITPGLATLDAQGRPVTQGRVTTHFTYNTFGELLEKKVGTLTVERNDFDAAGRAWRTKGSDGVARIALYDVDGRVTIEATSANRDLMALAQPGDWSETRIFETQYDALGNAVERVEPTDAVTSAESRQQVAFVQVEILQRSGFRTEFTGPAGQQEDVRLVWTGTNSLKLTWPSLAELGGSDVKVEVDYRSSEIDAGGSLFPSTSGTYSRIFEAWNVNTEAVLTWAANESTPGLDTVTGVRLFKKDNDGQWVPLIDRAGSSVYGIWITTQAPADPAHIAEIWLKPTGAEDSQFAKDPGAFIRFGDRMLYRYETIGISGSFDYQVRFDGVVADQGTFTVTSKVKEIAASERPTISGSGNQATVSWVAPAPGTLQRLRTRTAGGEWADLFDQRTGLNAGWLITDGAMNRLQLSNLPLGRFEYELLHYTGAPDDTLAAHANGTLTVGPLVALGPGADAAQVQHANVITWTGPDRAGAVDKIQIRSVNYGANPPAQGEWAELTGSIAAYGSKRGLSLDGWGAGAIEYRITFHESASADADYTEASGVVHVMPQPEANPVGMPATLGWTAPPAKLYLNGTEYTVQQVLRVIDRGNGQETNESQAIRLLADGRNGVPFEALGQINGIARAIDYTLEWRVAELGISLGTTRGHLRFGPAQPQLVTASDGQGMRLAWAVPVDLTGAPMRMDFHIRVKGASDWGDPKPFQTEGTLAYVDMRDAEPAEYEYRIEYFGRETAGGEQVPWATNSGSGTVVPQPRFGAAPDGVLVDQTLLNHILSWRAPSAAYPVTTTLVTRLRGSALETAETIQPTVGGREWLNFAGRRAGDYEYTLTFARADGSTLGTATGVLRLVPEPALVAGTGTVLTWNAAEDAWPGENIRQILEASPAGQGEWVDYTHLAVYDAASGRYQTDLGSLPPSAWAYRIRFVDLETNEAAGQATGRVIVVPAARVGIVAESSVPPPTLSWMTPPAGFEAVVRFGASTAALPDYAALPVYSGQIQTFNGRQGLSLAALPPGQYAYEIEYVQGAQSWGKLQGRFASAPVAQLTNIQRGTTFGGLAFVQDTPALHWVRATQQQPYTTKVVIRGSAGQTIEPAVYDFELDGQARSGVSMEGVPSGSYTYELTFTSASGEVLTSTGNFHHLNDARVANGILSWDAPPAGVTPVLKWRQHDPTNFGAYQTWRGDPHYQSVSLLLSFEGDSQEAALHDYSKNHLSPTVARAEASTAAKLTGETSAYLPVGGALYWTHPSLLMTGDFSVELGLRLDTAPTRNWYFAGFADSEAPNRVAFFIDSAGRIVMNKYGLSNQVLSGKLAYGQFNRIGIYRSGTTVYATVDGNLVGTASLSGTVGNGTGTFFIASDASAPPPAYIDDLRVTKGVARYTSSYAPTIDPYPIGAGILNIGDARQGVDLAGLHGPADYDYVVEMHDANGGLAVSTQGEVRLLPEITMGETGPSVLTWQSPPAGVTQQLYYKRKDEADFGEPVPHEEIPVLQGGRSGFDLANTPTGEYDVKVVFTRDDETWGISEATVKVISQASFGNDGDSVLSWTTPTSGITASLQVWKDGVPVSVTPTVLAGGLRSGVDFGSAALGTYTYKLTFVKNGQVFGTNEGSFMTSVPPTLGLESANVLLGSLGSHFSWTTPAPGSTQQFTYKNVDVSGIEGTLTGSQIPSLGNGLSGFDISGLAPGRYEYTLTISPTGGTPTVHSGEYSIIPGPSLVGASSESPTSFAAQQYIDILGRAGSASEIASLANQIASNMLTRAQAVKKLLDSSEAQGSVGAIARMYFAVLGRIPDASGVQHHLGRLRSGSSLQSIFEYTAVSPEFQSRYGVLSDAQFVDLLISQALARPSTTSEREYWTGQLGSGISRGRVLMAFTESAEYKQLSANKVLTASLYLQLLRQTPDAQGFQQHLDRLNGGSPATDAITAFIDSSQYQLRLHSSFTSRQYVDILGRSGSASEIASLANLLVSNTLTRGQAVKKLLDSSEAQGSVGALARMYFAAHQRFPDYSGFQHHLGRLRTGTSLLSIFEYAVVSPEFQSRNGTLSNSQFVDFLFSRALARPATTSERDYWIGQLGSGVSRGRVLMAIAEGAEFKQLSADKVLAATLFLQLLRRTPDTAGFQYHVDRLGAGATPADTAAIFLGSIEYQNRVWGANAGVAPATSSSGVVSWPLGAGGEAAAVYYNGQPLPATLQGGVYSVDVSNLAPDNYNFKIVYSDESGAYAQVDSTLSVVLSGDTAGTANNKAVFANALTISKSTGSDGNPTTRISFETGGATVTFRYQDAAGWHNLNVNVANNVGTVDVGKLPAGTYAYELVAVTNGTSYAHSTGTFTLSHAGESFTLPVSGIPGIYVNSSGQIRWPVPSQPINEVLFGWKSAGAAGDTRYRPYRVGNEFVVDTWQVGEGTFDAALIYKNINPVTGNLAWTHAAVGQLVTSRQTSTTTSYGPAYSAYTELASAQNNPSGSWRYGWKSAHGTSFVPFDADYPGSTVVFMPSWASEGTYNTPYVGIVGSDMAAHPGANHEVAVARWVAPSTGTWEVDIRFLGGGDTSQRVYQYGSSLLATGSYFGYLDLIAGQVVDVEIGDNGNYARDTTWFSASARLQTTQTTSTTTYQLVGLTAPTSYVDAVPGSPVAPVLIDGTPQPLPQTKTFALTGTQQRYFYRGANPRWNQTASTVTGADADMTSPRVAHQDWGTTGLVTQAAGETRELTTAVRLAVSHQDATESVLNAAVSSTLDAGTQHQRIHLSATSRQDSLFAPVSPYSIADKTVDGTVPVSLPFDLRYVETGLTSSPQTLTSTPVVRTGYDRFGQVTDVTDARNAGWRTRFTYNAAGHVLSQARPNEDATDSVTRATYDVQGHTASITDANGHTTSTTYDQAGNLIRQVNADGGNIFHGYDAFGNRTETWVQTGTPSRVQYSITKYQYDLKGQLTHTFRPDAEVRVTGIDANGYIKEQIADTQVQHWKAQLASSPAYPWTIVEASLAGSGGTSETHAYDSLGRRISTTLSATGADSETTRTTHDLRGQVLRQEGADGKATTYSYDVVGRKTTQTDAAGRTMEWHYDGASSRAKTHHGLDTVWVDYTYNYAGELTAEHTLSDRIVDVHGNRAGLHRAYAYNNRGLLVQSLDWSRAGAVQTSRYVYDAAGNRVREHEEITEGGITDIVQDNFLQYDAQGRLTQVADTRMKVSHSYDAAGNRTRLVASYRNDSDAVRQVDYAYAYDAMNRMTVEEGQLGLDGQVSISQLQGRQYAYDYAGRRISATSWGKQAKVEVETFPGPVDEQTGLPGPTQERRFYSTQDGYSTETYGYDAAGNLTSIGRDGIQIQQRRYDLKGRLINQQTPEKLKDVYQPPDSGAGETYEPAPKVPGAQGAHEMLSDLGYASQSTTLMYEAGSDRVSRQSVQHVGYDARVTGLNDGDLEAVVSYGYDTVGNLITSQTFGQRVNVSQQSSTAWQAIGDADRQVQQESHTHAGSHGKVQHAYDGAGRLDRLVHSFPTSANPDRRFFSDLDGRVLQMRHLNTDGTTKTGAGSKESFTIVRGEQLARVADNNIEETYKDEFGQVNAFSGQTSVPRQATGAKSYVVLHGDTLQKIAQAVYGDANLWYAIAEANGLSNAGAYDVANNPSGIRAGQALTLPDPAAIGASNRNSASTLRPYDPAQAIGDTGPNLPPPPIKKGSWLAKLLMVIVMIVVTVYTAGAAALANGAVASGATAFSAGMTVLSGGLVGGATLTAGIGAAALGSAALGGAVGSLAGQTVGVTTGLQESINWRGVALAAIGAGVTSGVGSLATPGSLLAEIGVMGRAAVGSVITQGIGVATGLQRSFDWRSVAAGAVGAGVGELVGPLLGKVFGPTPAGQFGARLATGLAAGAATAVTRGGKLSLQQVAVDAFGNALGSSLADAASGAGSQQPQPDAQVDAFVNAVNGFSQAGGVDYPGVQVAGGTRDEHIARMLRLASDPGSIESTRQADGTYRIEISGVGPLPDVLRPGPSLPSMYPDAYVTGGGTTSNGMAYEDWSTGARATEVRASEIVGAELGPLGRDAGTGSISAIGPVEGFFTLEPWGRGLKGFGGAALDTWLAAPRAIGGAANLIRDAWGYAANAVAPRRSVVSGEAFGYEPKSALLQSVQRNGVAGTIGLGITGAVRNAPGIGLIAALGAPNRDWGSVGTQTFNTGLAAAVSSLPGSRGVADAGRAPRYQTIDEVLLEVDRNADIATELARRAYQRGNISGSPQAFGTRAHSIFEGLNERLNRRLIGEDAPFRIAVEEFRDAAGIVTGRRAAGSIGADVRVFDATTGTSVRVLDLKTHGGVQISITPSRQQDFVNRFGLPAEEIYRQR